MIHESSHDYGTGVIILHFDGELPSLSEINDYLISNHGRGIGGTVEIEQPSNYRGFLNPGTVTIHP